jgi:AraC-like DNA-binding protein
MGQEALSFCKFTDFDLYLDSISDVAVDIRLLHVHQRFWAIQSFPVRSLQLQRSVEGSGFFAQGAMSADGWGFYVPSSERPVPVNGEFMTQGSVLVMPPGAEFCFSGQGHIEWCSLFVPTHLIESEHDPTRLPRSLGVVPATSRFAVRLRTALDRAFRGDQALATQAVSETTVAFLEDHLLSAVLAILDDSTNGETLTSLSSQGRTQLVHAAIEFIQDTSAGTPTVAKIAESIGTSERTLLYAFRDRLGLTPQAYLINHRLHEARRLLKAGQSRRTVASVATEFGFMDFGRFARRYHELFGELPSETLCRRP